MTTTRRTRPAPSLRARIIAAADDLFHEQGIRGVGVAAIAEAAGTNKMTLYRYFPSKDELVAEWARGIAAKKEAEWEDLRAKHPDDPQAQLVEWSRRVSAKLAAMERRGSMLANALAELPDPNHPARRVIRAHKLRERKHIQRLCDAAGFQDPGLAANLFALLLEGAHACVQGTGTRQIRQDLVRLVDLMVATRRTRGSR